MVIIIQVENFYKYIMWLCITTSFSHVTLYTHTISNYNQVQSQELRKIWYFDDLTNKYKQYLSA